MLKILTPESNPANIGLFPPRGNQNLIKKDKTVINVAEIQ